MFIFVKIYVILYLTIFFEVKIMNNYVGNSLQIRGAERYILQDGKGDGMHFIYVRNGKG